MDGLIGEAVFFLTEDLILGSVESQQVCHVELSLTAARQTVTDQYKRMLLEHGLRNKTLKTVSSVSDAKTILYPFWMGYIRKGNAYDFRALDAVSGEPQGMRMRRVFLRAFRQLEGG